MKTLLYLIPLSSVLILLMVPGKLSAQQGEKFEYLDSGLVHQYHIILHIDSGRAVTAAGIQAAYKLRLKTLLETPGLADSTLRRRMGWLIADKNSKLKRLLTTEEQARLIPTTELQKEQIDFIKNKLKPVGQ